MRNIIVTGFMRYSLITLLLVVLSRQSAYAQIDIGIGTGTTGNTTTTYPCPLQDYYEGNRSQYLYLASELTAAGMAPGLITAVKFNVVSLGTAGLIENYQLSIGHTTVSTLSTSAWDAFSGTPVTTPAINYQPVAGINSITLPVPFNWNGTDNILIEVCNGEPGNATGTWFSSNPVVPWTTGLAFNGSHNYRADNLGNLCGSATTTNTGTQTTRPNIVFSWTPATACTGTPDGGTASANPSTVCSGENFTLSISGFTIAGGISFQWQSSPDNTNWTNITGATGASYTTSQTASNWYRCVVTCSNSGVSANSTAVQVLSPALVSGTFTINNALPTGGTNFASFADAYNYIRCGIGGPVIFNVDPASGPYTEQLIITPVFGASATNTVTFNGNGRVLQFTSTNTNERAVIKLNGADHFIFDSLTINAGGTTTTEYGFGVQLLNGADSNIIRKCAININTSSTSTNYAGIVISASATSATTTGSADCDGNEFSDNQITGGYYSVTNVGISTLANQRNRFLRNIIRDFYFYGIYTNGTFQSLIEGNDISRPARSTSGTTAYGIYFTGLSTSALVNANRIHGLYDGMPTTTNDAYAITFTGTDALAGLENRVTNNVIYDMKSNGSLWGLYNSSSDNVFFYHNTVSFEDAASTASGTETTRGFYQVTAAAGIELKNNLITLGRGGSSVTTGIHFGTTTSTIVSNNNDVYFVPAANINYGFYTTAQATLANWQAASGQDANSVYVSPAYVNLSLGNLQPTAAGLNDLGSPVGVSTDIIGASRSATTPDIGAWEFTVGGCTAPPVAGDATSSISVPVCPNEPVTLGLLNNSFGIGQTYQWQSATDLAGPWTNLGAVLNNPTLNINPVSTFYYRCAVTCSGSTTYSTPVLVVVNALFPAGTYTINNALPTGGTNFNSYTDAVFALRCGIAGPIVFNVAPGSGPYNEQVIIGQIQGASATNTVTFNGNGTTITNLSTNTNERAVIKLNGTDHFIFDSLTVVPQGSSTTEYGFGFHLLNSADSNIIRNCTINLSTSTTSSNFAGIVSSIGTAATTTGINESDYNLFENNEINGGYYGITSVGSTTSSVANNRIINNRVKDFYFYGIYLSGNFNTLVEGNDISRPVRTALSTFYGIYVTSLNTSVHISKNRIHNGFDGNPLSTSTFAGIYFTGVDALAGLENKVTNNAVYNANGSGTQYGLYNSSSDNTLYYHNTVNLDGATATTSDTYGFYQVTTATGIELKDNLFTISRVGTGDKYGIYLSTSTSTVISDYNGFYLNATNAHIGYNGANRTSLADWQTASSQDASSVVSNPYYTSPATGNLEPRSPVLDNKGTPVTGITTDIRNLARSATTPDVGAWEFTVPACTAPPAAGTATAVPNTGICLGTPIQLDLTGYSIGAGQSFQWQVATAAAGPYSNLGDPKLFPDTVIQASGTFWYRCVVTCSSQSTNSVAVQVNMNPPFPSGVYTIDNTQPTTYPGGSNFNSFVEAVAVMDCGIDGPVTFNIAPGTYNEQVRMHRITGASGSSRVTFQSANGNPASVILQYDATVAGSNYVLQLDSASYITYRNITINALNSTNGRAVDMANTASYDSLLNNIITVPAATGTTQTVAGIHAANLAGGSNVIKGNTITGGISGIYYVAATAIASEYNVIDSNTVSGSYYYNIYTANTRFVSVSKNVVTLTAPRNTSAYGIYLSNSDSAYQVNQNRVSISGITGTTYGIYLTGCAADAYSGSVSANRITALSSNTGSLYGLYQSSSVSNYTKNNVININTSATTAYGMYTTGGNGIKYYNNSVQNASPAAGTANTAAYFSHSTSTAGTGDIRNNIFSHTASGIAVNYINVANIYSDYNMFYTAGPALIRQSTVNYATLQEWKDGQNWDYNSIVYTPAFSNDELQPDVANADVWAMHGRGVQITDNASDINGNARPVTLTTGVPDLGAYEFLPTVQPPVLPAIPAVPAAGTTQVFMFGTDTVQKITWAPASTVPADVSIRRYSGIIPPGLASGQASMYYYTDVTVTGGQSSSFTNKQYYIEPWMRDIPAEPTVKMGRTNAAGTWLVSSASSVDDLGNVITESGLSYMARFTGMTDGQAPPPPPPPAYTLDTSNRGKRFWVAYGHHYGFSSNSQDMVLYLSAQDSANVTVKVNGTNWVRNYAIPANSVRLSDLMPTSGLVDARITDEGHFNKGISIESDVPIVAYAHIYDGANSGAGLLLPTGTYGYEYKSLNSRQYYPTGGAGAYSWMMVIADRDSTLVEITPSVLTKGGRPAGVPFQVYLKRGEVYNIMGTQATGGAGTDITGSTIKSIPNASGKCYPIAVFSGSSRTAICNTTNGDNVIQQVFPSTAWGTKYLAFATANSASNNSYYSNGWRIMVKDPATVVKLNGVTLDPATMITPGNYYEYFTTAGTGSSTASYIEADQPVMVAQYMLSSDGTGCSGVPAPGGDGDPEMIYISPLEQGIKQARFYNTDNSAINTNYVNVIVPTSALSSLLIDGSNTFTDVFAHPGLPGYTCVRQNLGGTAGQHYITCDSAFNAITYGLGSVESYGYNAGTLVKNLSATPSFNNVFNTTGNSSYTCKGTPFRLTLQISVKPTQLIWQMSQVNNVTPNLNVTQVNPLPADSVTINGKKFYIYALPQQYTFSQTGTYNIPITVFHPSIEGCAGSVEITLPVSVIAAPVSDFSITYSGCVGDVAQFAASTTTSNGVPGSQWTWNFGDAGTGAGQTVSHTYAAAGTYNVALRGIAADGCIGDTTKAVTVNPRPTGTITQDTVYVCNNAAASFTVQNPVAGDTYNWYSAATGGTLLGTGTTYVQNNVTGFVNVYLEVVRLGCSSTTRDLATAGVLPTLVVPVATVDSVSTNTVVFRWTAVPNATGYEVSLNNGTTWIVPTSGSTGLTHTVSGLQLGVTVTLQVRALGGCLPAVSQPVSGQTVTDQVYIPNSFTPNGDGQNDVLRVYSNVIRSLRFVVFNQWGEKISESTSQNLVWDGTHKGRMQPTGVYIYVCDIILRNGQRIQRKGSINLVR